MIKFILDVFCKDTVIGLSQCEWGGRYRIYKNNQEFLFRSRKKPKAHNGITDPIAYHL